MSNEATVAYNELKSINKVNVFDYLESNAIQKDQNYEDESTAYIFGDGSAVILDSFGDISIDDDYGLNVDHEKL